MEFIYIQAFGFIGLLLIVLSFQKNQRSFVLTMHMGSALFFVLHLVLLGALTGAAIQFISALRAFVFHAKNKHQWLNTKYTMYFFIALFWIAGIVTWQGPISLLPVVAMTLECFALWHRDTACMRWLFLSARPGWVSYHALVGSYAGLFTEAFIITSLVMAIIRFDRKSKNSFSAKA